MCENRKPVKKYLFSQRKRHGDRISAPPLLCRKTWQNTVALFCSQFSDNLASLRKSCKTRCVCVFVALRAVLQKRHFARKHRLFLKISLSHFGANVQFCAQAWCVAPLFDVQHLENACCPVNMYVFCKFCFAPVGPCAPRGLSNHPWEHHSPCILRWFL